VILFSTWVVLRRPCCSLVSKPTWLETECGASRDVLSRTVEEPTKEGSVKSEEAPILYVHARNRRRVTVRKIPLTSFTVDGNHHDACREGHLEFGNKPSLTGCWHRMPPFSLLFHLIQVLLSPSMLPSKCTREPQLPHPRIDTYLFALTRCQLR